jgi:hypothetical protein
MAVFTAIAGVIGTALAGAIGLGAGATILGVSASSLIGGIIVTGALYGLQLALTPNAKPRRLQTPAQQYQAVVNQSVGPRLRGYGRVKVGGTRAFFDSKDGQLLQIIMCHHGEIDAFEEIWLGDRQVTVDSPGNVQEPPWFGYVSIGLFKGSPAQTAWAALMAVFPGVWTAEHRLRGVAYVAVSFLSPPNDKYLEVFPEGYNTPVRVVARLSLVVDTRSGLAAWSENPAMCIRDYLLHPDGYRLAAADLDEPSFIAFANVCDQLVPRASGGSERRYRIAGLYSLNDDPKEVLSRLLEACDGEIYETAEGKIALRGGEWTAPTFTLTDRDILSHALEQGNDAFAAFNQLRVIYLSPQHDYKTQEAASWNDLSDQAVRGVLSTDFTVDMCPSPSQARRLAKIHRAKQNPQWRGTITTNLVGLNARSQRIIRIVLPELGIDQDFRITSHGIRGDLSGCEIGVASIDASAYAWTTAEEGANPPPVQVTSPLGGLPAPTGLLPVVERRAITAGALATVVVATVNTPARLDFRLEAQIKLASASAWEVMEVAADQFRGVSGVLIDGETYVVRARFRTAALTGPWTDEETIVVTANPTAPAAPSGYSVALVGSTAKLDWTNPAANFYRSRVFRNSVNSFAGATAITLVSGLPGQPSTYTDSPGTGTWFYWVVALNESNVASSATASGTVTI